MKCTLLIIIGITLLASTKSSSDLNQRYEHILNGSGSLDKSQLRELYSEYLKEYQAYEGSNHFTLEAFEESIIEVRNHNKLEHELFKKGINQFSALKHQVLSTTANALTCPTTGDIYSFTGVPPQNWDWRTQKGVSTPIREQGFDGGQVAYQVASAFDFYFSIKYQAVKNYSPQQVLDCVSPLTTATDAYEYILKAGGLATILEYPRNASSTHQCQFSYQMEGVQLIGDNGTGTFRAAADDEGNLQTLVTYNGPVTALFNVNPDFLTYSSGIFTSTKCSTSTSFTATLLIIGFGEENGTNYWIIQNSWGTNWGEKGYARIVRGQNLCGIASCATFPVDVIDPEHEPGRQFQLALHNDSTDAKCLDGSPAGLYFSKGYGDGKKKAIIHFDGGAWCMGRDEASLIADCVVRSPTDLGSSTYWPHANNKDWQFNANKTQDMIFYNWNRFVFKYCDGSGHQGYRKDPIVSGDTSLYFRGYNNTIAHLNFIFSLLPEEQIDTFVVNGCSAGGLAVYTWVDFIQSMIKPKNPNVRLFGLPDSGFFLDYQNVQTKDNDFTLKMKQLYALVNKEVDYPNSACTKANPTDPSSCFLAQNGIKYLTSPLFMTQSQYDTWQVQNVLGFTCAENGTMTGCNDTEKTQIAQFKNETVTLIKGALTAANNRAAWSPACFFHCNTAYGIDDEANRMQIPAESGNTLGASIMQFMLGIKGAENWQFIDSVEWPNNGPCSKLTSSCMSPLTKHDSSNQFLTY